MLFPNDLGNLSKTQTVDFFKENKRKLQEAVKNGIVMALRIGLQPHELFLTYKLIIDFMDIESMTFLDLQLN